MFEMGEYIHFGTIALSVSMNALGVGIGQGLSSGAAIEAINQQPSAHSEINKSMILSIALIETAAILGTFVSMLLLMQTKGTSHSMYTNLAEIGVALAICVSGLVLGIASSLPARASYFAIARQPLFAQEIIRFMMISLSLLQTPIIFGLIVALLIQNQAMHIETFRDSLRLIGSGLAIGVGSIGPIIGLALFSRNVCRGIGMNRQAYRPLFSFMLISQALIETPIIFSLIIAITLLFLPSLQHENVIEGIALLAAGFCTAFGTLGAGISSGRTSMAAGEQIANNPENYNTLSRTSLFAQGLIETAAIYAILISFLLILYR